MNNNYDPNYKEEDETDDATSLLRSLQNGPEELPEVTSNECASEESSIVDSSDQTTVFENEPGSFYEEPLDDFVESGSIENIQSEEDHRFVESSEDLNDDDVEEFEQSQSTFDESELQWDDEQTSDPIPQVLYDDMDDVNHDIEVEEEDGEKLSDDNIEDEGSEYSNKKGNGFWILLGDGLIAERVKKNIGFWLYVLSLFLIPIWNEYHAIDQKRDLSVKEKILDGKRKRALLIRAEVTNAEQSTYLVESVNADGKLLQIPEEPPIVLFKKKDSKR